MPVPQQVRALTLLAKSPGVKTFEATLAISLSSWKVSTAAVIHFLSHLASLFSNPIISPLDLLTPRFTPPANPMFSFDSTKTI